MNWSDYIVRALKHNGIRLIAYVPDAITWQVLRKLCADPFFDVVRCTREDESIGIVSGAYLGGVRGAIFMQSSGFGNCINALGSLSIPCRIPAPIFVSVRGGLGEFNIAQVTPGRVLPQVLENLALPYYTPRFVDEVEPVVNGAIKLCYASRLPVGLLLSSSLTGAKNE